MRDYIFTLDDSIGNSNSHRKMSKFFQVFCKVAISLNPLRKDTQPRKLTLKDSFSGPTGTLFSRFSIFFIASSRPGIELQSLITSKDRVINILQIYVVIDI